MPSTDAWKIAEIATKDGRVRFFMKNMSPAREPADPAYPYLAYVTFRYGDSDERGLPQGDDLMTVQDIENSAAVPLEADHVAVHVAEVLGHGVKDLLFYVRDLGIFAERSAQLLRKYSSVSPSIEITLDAAWTQYTDFP